MIRLVRGESLKVLAGAITPLVIQPAVAEETKNQFVAEVELGVKVMLLENVQPDDTQPEAAQLRHIDSVAITVDDWLAQMAQDTVIEITNIQVDETIGGVTLLLETNGELAAPKTSITGNTVIANIPNTVMNLSEGEEVLVRDPAAGIALVNVTNLPDNRVRIAITGTDAPPMVDIRTSASSIIVSATLGDPTAQTPTDELIRIVVTGDQIDSDYYLPNASTATRTDTPILDIPASIQVIPQQVLEDQQITNIVDALSNVSGVSADSDRGVFTDISIRGFSQTPILLDGFRLFGSTTPEETAYLERIEVLRGPASILFGEVQPGGVVNFVTKKPTAEPSYNIELQAGSFGLIRPRVDLSGPLSDDGRLLYRLNAVYNREDGFRDFDTDYERFFVAPVVTWQIGDRTDLRVSLDYLDEELPFDSGLVAFTNGDGVADIPFDRITNEPDDINRREFLNVGYSLEHRFSDNWTLRNAFRYTEQDRSADVALPFDFDQTTNIVTRFFAAQDEDVASYSLQANVVGEFATGSIDHTLLAGTDLNLSFNEGATFLDFTPLPLNIFDPEYGTVPRPDRDDLTFIFGEDSETRRLGIYLQDQIAFGDSLILLAGLRYDTVSTEDSLNNTDGDSNAVSPRVGIVYQPIEPLSLYASYSRSFTPSFSLNAEGELLEPERGEGYEVGVKTELLEGALFASLAYFNITRQNVATSDPAVLGASVATGEQSSQGIELDLRGKILPGWNWLASYSYIDAEVTEDNDIPVGNDLPGVPKNSASLWTTYEIQSGDLQGLGFGLGFNFVGERAGDRANTFEVDSYFITNAAVFYERKNWRAALNFRNIFDVEFIQGAPFDNVNDIEPGDPFTVIGSISARF